MFGLEVITAMRNINDYIRLENKRVPQSKFKKEIQMQRKELLLKKYKIKIFYGRQQVGHITSISNFKPHQS